MAKFLPFRDVFSASEDDDEDDNTYLTDEVDGLGDVFQKFCTKFKKRSGSRKRAKKKRKKEDDEKEKEKKREDLKPPVDEHEYDFYHAKRGMAIIINNEKFHSESQMKSRKGSGQDALALESTFKQLGFNVSLYHNRTTQQMVSILKEAASNRSYDHGDADCFACAILSHGWAEVFRPRDGPNGSSNSKVRHDVVFGVDGTLVPTRFLLSIFNDECCPELAGKPRMFFIQACRGGQLDEGTDIKVLSRKMKSKQSAAGIGLDEQDAQPYVSESKSEDEVGEDETLSAPGHETETNHEEKESESSAEQQKLEDISNQSEKDQESYDPEINDAKRYVSAVQETKKDHPTQESSVQESQAPAEETRKEETGGATAHAQSTELVSGEEEVVYSRMAMEKILTVSPPPLFKDFILVYASPPGYFAWRRTTGAWLIQTLAKVFRTADVTTIPLTRLLTIVSRRVCNEYETNTKKKLIPCVMSMLTKDVYFRSKHW